ncbi:MAG: HD-GYP domain-containing protein [Clostridiales bacterium]|jgi:putative nucleotidyltransferase with HDIG domain|nr:HD-GYP domain-containing protein [Clostridiales bacterium]
MSETSKPEELFYDQQITLANVQPGMILSSEVVTEDGSIFMRKGTVLTANNIKKLQTSRVDFIIVKTKAPKRKYEPAFNTVHWGMEGIPVQKSAAFKEFVENYDESTAEIKKYVMAISDGATINLDELFKLTNGVMEHLKCKSDVLTFLGYIKEADEHTFTHSNNVALLCNLFAKWLRLSARDVVYLTTAGILHDIGKTRTPPEILNKAGPLKDEEFKIMKRHTIDGYEILKNQNIPESIKLAALMHHEKINGKGYPYGLLGENIETFAKIVSIVDIYDAMTANRIYRAKLCPFEVIRMFETKVYGEIDTENLIVFLRNIAYTYLGNYVKLTDGQEGTVVFINQQNLSKPIVRLTDGRLISLAEEENLSVLSLA